MNYPIRNAKQRIYTDRMRAWIRAKDSNACLLFVAEMTQSKNPDALPALMELLRMPDSLWKRSPAADMCEVREAAVHAIAHIDPPDALACIGTALFSHCACVRAAASQLLRAAGAKAAEPLARKLTWRQEWSVEGMCILLYLLGSSKNFTATLPLTRAVTGELPIPPSPRTRDTYKGFLLFAAPILLFLFLAIISVFLDVGNPGVMFGLLGLSIPLGIILSSTGRSPISQKEKRALQVAACEALQMLGDKKAIPTLLVASHGDEREVAKVAKVALYSLLPLLCAEDTEWLTINVRHQLATLLHQRDPELVLPVLRAMEFIGVDVAMRRIYSMMTYGTTPVIRAEATRIYPILLERQHQEKISGTLLRASQSPLHAQGELLRPVTANPDPAPQELLRATNRQGE